MAKSQRGLGIKILDKMKYNLADKVVEETGP